MTCLIIIQNVTFLPISWCVILKLWHYKCEYSEYPFNKVIGLPVHQARFLTLSMGVTVDHDLAPTDCPLWPMTFGWTAGRATREPIRNFRNLQQIHFCVIYQVDTFILLMRYYTIDIYLTYGIFIYSQYDFKYGS